MTKSFDFSEVEFFTVGTLGPRGERAFFLQGRASGELISLKVEKQQVSALADYLDQVLEDLPEVEQEPLAIGVADLDLREPVVPAFTVGGLGVAYASDEDRLVIMAEELLETDEPDENETARARFLLRRDQVANWIERAREIVSAGRPPCPFCGTPLQPRNGDWCSCSN
ncbi:MAG: DUF3090 family protein [Acidimicrobiaceae bacterium]|jgi:uncharacterized repeat protein (TIGR03847 family)|nr:DUF3090 family protein [Acidimicrobiaceae bacterium]MBT5578744.1 DUF3090 family protein [Acidimicrobiaceae bacterium]MBT5851593.1 DUF3090 family protein [Acidimicrobiaceae bacterium]